MRSGESRTKPGVSIFLNSMFHARSVLESELLSNLIEEYQLEIICTPNIFNEYKSVIQNFSHFLFSNDIENLNLNSIVMNAGAWRYRKRSKSFRYRLKRIFFGNSKDVFSGSNTLYFLGFIRRTLTLAKYMLLGSPLIYPQLTRFYKRRILNNPTLRYAIKSSNAHICVIWSQGLESESMAVIKFCRIFGKVSILVADNWDNLFSKTVIIEKPDYVGCFGLQSINSGAVIHGLDKTKMFAIGSARFEVYRQARSERTETDRNIVLFAGSSMPEEDYRVLEVMKQVRSNLNPEIGSELIWKYRPHPFPQYKIDSSRITEFPFLGLAMQGNLNSNDSEKHAWPKLDDSRDELQSARLVICMPTSYILEARINSVPVIAVTFQDQKGITSSFSLYNGLLHLQGINAINGLTMTFSESELYESMMQHISEHQTILPDLSLDYFVNWSEESFSKKLSTVIRQAINESEMGSSKSTI
jgi:hypothetical protein